MQRIKKYLETGRVSRYSDNAPWWGEIPIDIPEHVLAERAAREKMIFRDTTAVLMGDPLPGYSALDRRV
jgi:hypothetical protein